ncbi:lysylphosphatidylglycerol biosynthesis bifunctional protein LysX [Rhizocola hellebori]|uniref:Lysine--tRNA ligase n=1 Tax=Rhizocola hellebori TaxID=1392758 RepID=A0A8J3Q4D4_9ACTN|nr:bifunctional lysylphosphatidylglycerol synthetase/lysine--tRNA ligase LysX [Rhizocola hellebori]GIH03569.1 lysylphosphatidylglycerol biosynthesis bifunctional protein LysX [Rhizocola hellebori]
MLADTKDDTRHRKQSHSRAAKRDWPERVPTMFAVLLTVVAALCALAALHFGMGQQPIRRIINAVVVPAPANLAYAAFVALLAAATARRKRVAWWIMMVYFGLQLMADLLGVALLVFLRTLWTEDLERNQISPQWWEKPAVLASAMVTATFVTLLLLARRKFNARVQRASLPKAVAVYLLGVGLSLGLGYLLVHTFPNTLQPQDYLPYAAEKVFGGFNLHIRVDQRAHSYRWVSLLLGLFGAVALLAAFFTLFRTQRKAAELHGDEEIKIRQLLAGSGDRDSLGYFATRRDKSVIFSPTGKAALTYRPVAGVSLASGDPIGDPEAWSGAIKAWLHNAREFGWRPAVMGASEEGATAYAQHGLKVIELGDEAILHVRDFQLDGRDMRQVRQAVNRIERAGFTARVRRHSAISPQDMREAQRLAELWRDTDAERGFSMALSRLNDPWDGDCVLVEALDVQGKPAAILSFVPWGANGLSLDLMRRDRDSGNGLMEFMVAAVVREAPRLGIERISLNFAVFRSAFEEGARIGAGPVLRAWRRLLLFFSRWWQLESLYRSNVKYHPEWVPRFLCFRERRELATIGVAAAIAEGFLVLPWQRGHLTPGPPPTQTLPALARTPERKEAKRPEQVQVRLSKLNSLADPYPVSFARTHAIADVQDDEQVAVAGRVILVRDHGKIAFATLRDWSGDIQVIADCLDGIDVGDLIGVTGRVGRSRKGEKSIVAQQWVLTAKCLHPLPNKHLGLADPEAKVRRRYLDLIVSPQSRGTLRTRGAVLHSLRTTLHSNDFLEVETPILQPIHGGANARPFLTHINAYDMRLYLRIAPELYLKRLCVGGVEKLYELGRTFRNEGVSFKHNPEFTMLEAYQAYADYMTMLDLTRDLIQNAAREGLGTTTLVHDGAEYDIGGAWPVVTVNEAISRRLGEEVTPGTPVPRLQELANAAGVSFDPAWGHGQMILELYERLVEAHTKTPTFYRDFPAEVSPLARQHRDDPRLAERWDLVAFGTELGTAHSELVDPVEQRRRLTAQSLKATGGDPEAMELDEDFLEALEFAMPPTGGLGIGVDRLVMLLTAKTIRETLPFPLVRPSGSRSRATVLRQEDVDG